MQCGGGQAGFIATATHYPIWLNNTKFALIGDPAGMFVSPSGWGVIDENGVEPMRRRDHVTVTGTNAGATAGASGVALVRASDTAEFHFDDCRIPQRYLVGEENQGFYYLMNNFQGERLIAGLLSTAGAQLLIEEAIEYGKQREAFGRPIAEFQLMQQKIAYMSLWYETARLLYLKAGWLKNQGVRNTRETSQAKWYATDHSVKAALEAVQLGPQGTPSASMRR